MRRIVVVGSGLAGLRAARTLESRLEGRRHTELTVVTESTHFVYRPLLAHLLSKQLDSTALSITLGDLLDPSTEVVVEQVQKIDRDARSIVGEEGTIPFDYLVLAPRAAVDWQGHTSWRRHAQPFETPDDAADILQMLSPERFEHGDAPGRIVIIGSGPNGIELAGQLQASFFSRADGMLAGTEITVVDSAEVPLPNHPSELRQACWSYLRERGVGFRGNASVVDIRPGSIALDNGNELSAISPLPKSVFWCGGIRPPQFVCASDFSSDAGRPGQVSVDETLAVRNETGIYAAGVTAAPPDSLPTNPESLLQQGRAAAENLLADLSGRTPLSVQLDAPTWSISLGPDKAAAYRHGAVVTGGAAETLHRLRHTSLIPGLLQKVGLLGTWM
jgi:NADH dehydrogenase